ncbi:MAG: hypothetical protein ACREUI_04835 [Burkholderiales bacterium]
MHKQRIPSYKNLRIIPDRLQEIGTTSGGRPSATAFLLRWSFLLGGIACDAMAIFKQRIKKLLS